VSKTYFVVSDVHGFYSILKKELKKKKFDLKNPDHILVVAGDLFDRGNEAVELFKFVQWLNNKKRFVYVRGNHEDLLEECVKELNFTGGAASSYHYSNGTISTCMQLQDERYLKKVLKFIKKNCVNYFEVDKYIIVHGWIPSFTTATEPYETSNAILNYNPDWRNSNDYHWECARWVNGMKACNDRVREKDKTIVCGHWHSGYGHFNLHKKYGSEYECFEPFEDAGIIALDAMTAYSKRINVLKIKE